MQSILVLRRTALSFYFLNIVIKPHSGAFLLCGWGFWRGSDLALFGLSEYQLVPMFYIQPLQLSSKKISIQIGRVCRFRFCIIFQFLNEKKMNKHTLKVEGSNARKS